MLNDYVRIFGTIYDKLQEDEKTKHLLDNVSKGQWVAHWLTNNTGIEKRNAYDLKYQNSIPSDTIISGVKSPYEIFKDYKIPSVFYRNEILNALRQQGISTDGIYNQRDLLND